MTSFMNPKWEQSQHFPIKNVDRKDPHVYLMNPFLLQNLLWFLPIHCDFFAPFLLQLKSGYKLNIWGFQFLKNIHTYLQHLQTRWGIFIHTISKWILKFSSLLCWKVGREQFSLERKLSPTKELSRTVYYGVTIFHEIHVSTTISKADYFFGQNSKKRTTFFECKLLSSVLFFPLWRIFQAQFKFSFRGFFVWSLWYHICYFDLLSFDKFFGYEKINPTASSHKRVVYFFAKF